MTMETSAPSVLNIKLTIVDRVYPMKIKPEEEENVRNACILVNRKVKELQSQYEASDRQDYLAMAALMFAEQTISKESRQQAAENTLKDKIKELDGMLAVFGETD